MRKLVTVTLSIFLLLGITSPVLAAPDTTGDNFVSDVDLVSASVVTSSQTNPRIRLKWLISVSRWHPDPTCQA